jgi:hypothetical protein
VKYILKKKQKLSWPLILATVITPVLALLFLILDIRYSDDLNQASPLLQTDTSLSIPRCDQPSGFYTHLLPLKLSAGPGLMIYYTLDGSMPDLNSQVYNDALLLSEEENHKDGLSFIPTSPRWRHPVGDVFQGYSLRAIAVNSENKKSRELIRTFFVDEKGGQRYTLPVMALTIDKDDFFGFKSGIYVMGKNYEDKRDYISKNLPLDLPWWEYPSNYMQRGKSSVRKAYVEFFESDKKPVFNDEVRVRVSGNATRSFSQKSLRIDFSDENGLNCRIFPGYPVERYHSLILRNGGNDWNKTMMRDALMQSLMSGTRVDIQAYRPLIVFLNGEYWGLHTLRERLDENYLSNKYGIRKDSLVILEFSGTLVYGEKKDDNDFKDLLKYVKENDLGKEENYSYIQKKIDIESFMDCIISNVYFCNADWPNNNVRFWRYRLNADTVNNAGCRDGRWRWMIYDLDWGFGYTGKESVKRDMLDRAIKVGSIGILFRALLKNEEFIENFDLRFRNYLSTRFEKAHVIAQIDNFQNELKPEMPEHINRWRSVNSYEEWIAYVEELRVFASERPSIQLSQLQDFIKTHKAQRNK